jgi:dTDP-glucose 4,6-dehydratase
MDIGQRALKNGKFIYIESELGWKPKYDFDTAIQQTIDWYIQNQSWWSEILTKEYLNYYQDQYGSN